LARNQERLESYLFEIIFEVDELIGHFAEFSAHRRALARHAGEVRIERAAMEGVFAEKDRDRGGLRGRAARFSDDRRRIPRSPEPTPRPPYALDARAVGRAGELGFL
jgi:hypothetical protein